MRIQPISTTNNNIQFKQLKIYKPQEWDVEVLDRVVNNPSIREYTAYLAKMGKDLVISAYLKPIPGIMTRVDDKWETIIRPEADDGYTKEALFKSLDKFDYKEILKRNEEEALALETAQEKRIAILAEVDVFNKTIEPKEQIQQSQPQRAESESKKRNFFQCLFGLK